MSLTRFLITFVGLSMISRYFFEVGKFEAFAFALIVTILIEIRDKIK